MSLISVIIPIYNVENYIEECILSVLNQTLKDIEIICVNDGTPDNSMKIVERYAEKDKRIVIVNKENSGLSFSRNVGLKVATGEYVIFLDSDDYIIENALEYLYNEARNNQLDTVYFDAESFFENKELQAKHKSYVGYYQRDAIYEEVVSGQRLLANMDENGEFRPSACLQMNRRSMLIENKIEFYPGIIHEDNLFTLLTTIHTKRVKHIAKSFYMRRVREGSIMTSINNEKSCEGYYVCIKEVYPKIVQLVKDADIFEAYMKRLKKMRSLAVKAFNSLPEEDRRNLFKGSNEDALLFELLIEDYADMLYKKNTRIKEQREEIRKLKAEKKKVEASQSYKIGKIITLIPRALRAFKRKGIRYCVDRTLYKVAPRICENDIKVSVIIPVYNAEKYLKECLDSLQKQTLKGIEIICVDDESTDKSLDILYEFQERDSRIRILQQKHMGAGNARNKAIREAKGKYLLFLDSDDFFNESMCEKAYYQACKYKAEIVLFAAERQNMQTGKKQKMNWVLRSDELPHNKAFSAKDISDRLFQVTSNASWSKLYKKQYILEKDLEYQNIKHTNDAYFTRSAMSMAKRMVVLDEILVTYRYNDGTNTQSVKHLAPLEFFKAFKAVKEKLEAEGLFEVYRKSYINWVVTESLFNYKTMKTDEAKEAIKTKLLEGGFEELGVVSLAEEECYTHELYEKYKAFIG